MTRFEREFRSAQKPRSTAELAALGVSRNVTRGPRRRRVCRGYYTPVVTGDPTPTPTQRILDIAPLIPVTGALTGWAAAYVHGVDQLDGLDPMSMAPLPITINLGRDLGRASTERIIYSRELLPQRARQIRHGLSVTTPPRTAFDGTRWASDLVEAVAFLDQVTHVFPVSTEALAVLFRPGGRWTGIDQFSAGRDVDRFGRGECLGVAVADVRDAASGHATSRGQPTRVRSGRALPGGQYHRKRRQHRSDNIREEELELVNLTVCRVGSLDLGQPAGLRTRLCARRAQGLARDRQRDRWTLVQPDWWRRRMASRQQSGSQRG